MLSHRVYLGLGTNLGNREQNLQEAIRLIGKRVGKVTRQSSFIQTEPWGFESENLFLNAVILCETEQSPREVLLATQQIERDMGRNKELRVLPLGVWRCNDSLGLRVERTYADRVIDIDILLYDDLTVDEPDLKIPHPLMQQRDFVMKPLGEIRGEL